MDRAAVDVRPEQLEDVAPERYREGGSHLPRKQRDEAIALLIEHGYSRTTDEAWAKVKRFHRLESMPNPEPRNRHAWMLWLARVMSEAPGGRARPVSKHRPLVVTP